MRKVGDRSVFSIGLGAMPLSFLDDRDRAIATIHTSLDLGVTMIDTAHLYAPSWDAAGHNEMIIRDALSSWTGGDASQLVVASKAGLVWGPSSVDRNANLDNLRASCAASLAALDRPRLDLLYLHWPAPEPSYADQVENMLTVQQDGLVHAVGLCNVMPEHLEIAVSVGGSPSEGGVVAVQNEFSPRYRERAKLIERTAELGIAFVPWSPLGGADRAAEVGGQYTPIAEIAADRGVSPQQVALAWEAALSPNVIPIPGCSRPETISDCVQSVELTLTQDEMTRVSTTEPEGTSQFPAPWAWEAP